ncbi:hypothetical protein AB0H73_30275 [Streptomyces olivoreticuli]|uniref:hypothetical protein n=1 Tax=Streptomyces olivoreticuli TaxID=68246 RepID=UPI0013C32B23|nr:hypothetical protein [Streptomyces olivoreticuli]
MTTPDAAAQAPVPPARCEECRRIKAGHYEASRGGDLQKAKAWTAEMGRHVWAAHA